MTSGGLDWQREKWKSGFGAKFIHQGEKNVVKYADEIIVLSKGVQDYFKNEYNLAEVILLFVGMILWQFFVGGYVSLN